MKIVIGGAGRIGSSVAKALTNDKNDVTVIDNDLEVIDHLAGDVDAICIHGSLSDIEALKSSGINEADLFLALTDKDELNMVSALCAKKLGAKYAIARIRNIEYSSQEEMLKEIFGLTIVVNPELECANEISTVLRFPGAVKMLKFANGSVELSDYIIPPTSPLNGLKLIDIKKISKANILICVVSSNDSIIIPFGDYTLKANDRISIIGSKKDQKAFYESINAYKKPVKSVMILGGNRISQYLCKILNELSISTTIIEKDRTVCDLLCDVLPDTKIICGDGLKSSVLYEEGLLTTDAFISISKDDGENLITSLFAKNNNVPIIISKVEHEHFSAVLSGAGLNTVFIPKKVIADKVVGCVRAIANSMNGPVKSLYRFEDNRVEASEFRVNNNIASKKLPIKDLKLKKNVLIGAVVRNGKVFIPNGNTILMENDDIIIIAASGKINTLEAIIDEQ